MNKIDRRSVLFSALAAVLYLPIVGAKNAKADTVVVYDQYGTQIVVNTATLTGPVTYYNVTGAPYVVYPAVPAYAPAPIYGAAGVRGQARRVSRRTSRRVTRR